MIEGGAEMSGILTLYPTAGPVRGTRLSDTRVQKVPEQPAVPDHFHRRY